MKALGESRGVRYSLVPRELSEVQMLARYRIRPLGWVKDLLRPREGVSEGSKFLNFGWRCANGKKFFVRPGLPQWMFAKLDEESLLHLEA